MYQKRSNEKTHMHLDNAHRSSRGFEINGQWYFDLRDGGQKGPYDNELAMRAELNEFINLYNQMDQRN